MWPSKSNSCHLQLFAGVTQRDVYTSVVYASQPALATYDYVSTESLKLRSAETIKMTMVMVNFVGLEFGELLGAFFSRRDVKWFLLVRVEVARVTRALRLGQERSFDLLLVESNPVRVGEPLVLLDVCDAVLQVTIALRQIDLQLVAQQVLDVGAEV
jgi:hypothetical protein